MTGDEGPDRDLDLGQTELSEPGIKVILLRGMPVIVDAVVAAAFGVETREVNQAIARNAEKFKEHHAFRVTETERDFLRSQGVIPKAGRGGSRALPYVFSQKGVARLATVLTTKQALDATDLVIDIFVEVHQQIERGRNEITITEPSRLLADGDALQHAGGIRLKLLKALEDLLDMQIDRKKKITVRDELGEMATNALDFVKSHLNAKGIENQRVVAETMHVLEQARALRERTRVEVEKSEAETESILLQNLDKKLAILERMQHMLTAMEPSSIVSLSHSFVRPPLLIQGPRSTAALPASDDDDDA